MKRFLQSLQSFNHRIDHTGYKKEGKKRPVNVSEFIILM